MDNILSTVITNACAIYRLSQKNYDILCKGLFSYTMPKARKMLGPALVYLQLAS